MMNLNSNAGALDKIHWQSVQSQEDRPAAKPFVLLDGIIYVQLRSTIPSSLIRVLVCSLNVWWVPDGYCNVDIHAVLISAAMPGFSATENHATGRFLTMALTDASYKLDIADTATVRGLRYCSDRLLGPAVC